MRAIKWHPEMGVASIRTTIGRVVTASEDQWMCLLVNEPDIQELVLRLVAQAKERPNEWIAY